MSPKLEPLTHAERGRIGGTRSAAARRGAVAKRDRRIAALLDLDRSYSEIAAEVGITRQRVGMIAQRIRER